MKETKTSSPDQSSTQNTAFARLSLRKRMLFGAAILVAALLAVEVGMRVVFAFRIGPSVLWYGFQSSHQKVDTNPDPNALYHGYTKYKPHQIRYDSDYVTGERFPVRINAVGFRGADFHVEKPDGVTRVVTLGASSTFGWYSRDNETYPFVMEGLLNNRCPHGKRFEVVNLGVPHLKSQEIVALFTNEALPLQPDVVTYYQGINDCYDTPERLTDVGHRLKTIKPLRKAFRALRSHVLLVDFVDKILRPPRKETLPAATLTGFSKRPVEFIANISKIRDECRVRGIIFIVATQQAQSMIFADHTKLKGVTYDDERRLVRHRLDEDGSISRREMHFLAHADLMDALRDWTRREGVSMVGIIEALDQRRDVLVSWVHLTPEGNRMIAEQFAREILRQTCPDS